LLLGAGLRFYRLGSLELRADEGASWAAAVAPNLRIVVREEQDLDPGKLALYDLMLHGWIGMFGDSLFAMRAMSATLGTIAIVLVFAAVREILISLGDHSAGVADDALDGKPGADELDIHAGADKDEARQVGELAAMAGAFAAMLYATNLGMVLSDRTVRMYSLVVTAELLQIMFLVRAQRRGGAGNYIGIAIFTAAMIAANFTASFLLAAEALWFAGLQAAKFAGARAGGLAIFRPGFAVLAGLALLGPMMPGAIASSAAAVRYGAINWLKLQPISWPYAALRGSAGSYSLFNVLVALGVFGAWWNWRRMRLASGFFGAWVLGPLVGVMAVTYLIRPIEYPRYVIIAFVGLFAFAALGAGSVRPTVVRAAVATFLIYLSLHPLFHHWKSQPVGAAWGKAAAIAALRTAPGARIAVFPAFADNVVRYYLPSARRANVVGVQDRCGRANVLIMSGFSLYSPANVAKIEACYPNRVAALDRVEVRTR
jgi:uncharacterized membrane protein